MEAGTGAVHTAPAHGVDDYVVGQKYGLPVDNPVGDNGRFFEHVPLVGGLLGLEGQRGRHSGTGEKRILLKRRSCSTAIRTAGGTRRRSFSARRPSGLFPWTRESEIGTGIGGEQKTALIRLMKH